MAKKIVEVIVERPDINLWNKSLTEILHEQPGNHAGKRPVALINKYFFDYQEEVNIEDCLDDLDLNEEEDAVLEALSKKIKDKTLKKYSWSGKSYTQLKNRVKSELGNEYVSLIENKLVLLCEVEDTCSKKEM